MPPFAQGQKESQQDGAYKKPGGELHFDNQASGYDSNKKTCGDQKNIKDDDMLKPERIGNLKH